MTYKFEDDLRRLTESWVAEKGQWYLDVLLPGIWDGSIEFLHKEKAVIEKLKKQKNMTLTKISAAIRDNSPEILPENDNRKPQLKQISNIAPDQSRTYAFEGYEMRRFSEALRQIGVANHGWKLRELKRLACHKGLSENYFGVSEKVKREKEASIVKRLRQEFKSNPNINIDKFLESCPKYIRKAAQDEFNTLVNSLSDLAKLRHQSVQPIFSID